MKNIFQRKYFIIIFVSTLLVFAGGIFLKSKATNFAWNQTFWSGEQTSNVANHNDDETGWNEYSTKDSAIGFNGSGDVQIAKADNWQETTDTDFNTNTSKDSTISVSGNSIRLLKADGAACSSASDCQSNLCTGNVCVFSCGNSTITKNSITYGTVLGEDSKCWLDRNLGATRQAIAYDDSQAYGWLFQWGRSDDGHQIPTSSTTATNSSSDTPGHAYFITETTFPGDWRVPQNSNLWQGVSGINNPCPTGFRLPTNTEWSTLISAAGITNSATAFSSSLKLTVAGFRLHTNGENRQYQNSEGNYCSSTVISASYGPYLHVTSSGVSVGEGYRGIGRSVRCVKN